ncbi:toprim domain-containing protein [Bradyrhizobium diazoefficiens]|nr:toprim domain-containing protein [Bradyrhizobium diazoefficiens]MBR0703134.1 toprim domain-containing protein [Bradyrhizobium diazoefficiens]MBR0771890.1 toprim domain-containing protein [Bradyrhizobium diazoefficiens]
MSGHSELDLQRRENGGRGIAIDDDQIIHFAARLGGEVEGSFICCPSPGCPDDDRSMSVRVTGPSSFFIYDHLGPRGAAYAHVRKRLGIAAVPARDNSDRARRILSETVPADGTLAERYLRGRAITLPVPESLRFHCWLRHARHGSIWPAMVAERRNAAGELTAVHRTYLARDGRGKAPVEPERMDLGNVKGTAIRLSPLAEELLVGEGIETTLSVMQVTGKPGWAAGSAGMMRELVLPQEVRSVIILVDGDVYGEQAASAARVRWVGEGRSVRMARAPKGTDFNDLLMQEDAL